MKNCLRWLNAGGMRLMQRAAVMRCVRDQLLVALASTVAVQPTRIAAWSTAH